MSDANAVPVIDLGPYLAGEPGVLDRTAAELRHALTEIGFYSIVNHGMPSALVDAVYRQVARFHAQSLKDKLKIKLDRHNVGYLPMMGDTLRTSGDHDVGPCGERQARGRHQRSGDCLLGRSSCQLPG
jgi:isopenicillin N synthase-like dioxygenase